MILHIDHVTVVVRDVGKATAFFALLGFVEEKSAVISGPTFARYMGVEGIEADCLAQRNGQDSNPQISN